MQMDRSRRAALAGCHCFRAGESNKIGRRPADGFPSNEPVKKEKPTKSKANCATSEEELELLQAAEADEEPSFGSTSSHIVVTDRNCLTRV